MSRGMLVVGNWKLHKTLQETASFCEQVRSAPWLMEGLPVQVGIAPPFTSLSTAHTALAGCPVRLAAQHVFWEPSGAFTGEVSAPLLADAGCDYALVGHSERRSLFGDTDDLIARRLRALQHSGLTPILCVGETLDEREQGCAEKTVLAQLQGALGNPGEQPLGALVVAYEPVWAIGTGRVAAPQDAQAIHQSLRGALAGYGPEASETLILYGGSVKPDSASAIFAEPDIDGGLVGGASLDFEAFSAIVRAAQRQAGAKVTGP